METNRLMWSAIFNSFLHPCAATDVMLGVGVDMSSGFIVGVGLDMFSEVILGVSVDVLPDIVIAVMVSPAVTLTGVMVYAVDVMTDVPSFVTFDVVPAIDVDMFADENVRGLAAVMTPSEFTSPAPWEESMWAFCCR